MINISQLCTTYSTVIRRRNRLTAEKTESMNRLFILNPRPDRLERQKIASELDIGERTVQVWFQNRRAKVKRSPREKESSSAASCQAPEGKSFAQEAKEHKRAFELTRSRALSMTCPNTLPFHNWSWVPNNVFATEMLLEREYESEDIYMPFP
ncbi:hypothetical protein INT43_004426 [Umbelopsis isabellina]|uniref:Homeobox domain-containing protein n=1 Tax=Mortierella isabellina TaxID=91625 RepID=A0A8H7PID5_MORIS|nr:hypothetical protein INT43_004426 [Umbelopsis isabellina]